MTLPSANDVRGASTWVECLSTTGKTAAISSERASERRAGDSEDRLQTFTLQPFATQQQEQQPTHGRVRNRCQSTQLHVAAAAAALHTNPGYIVREQGNVMGLFFTCREKLITLEVVQLLYNCFVVAYVYTGYF